MVNIISLYKMRSTGLLNVIEDAFAFVYIYNLAYSLYPFNLFQLSIEQEVVVSWLKRKSVNFGHI